MRPTLVDRVLLLGILVLSVALIDPRGEFPLNDDWNFTLTTWKFADSGDLQYSRFTAMTLKTQVLWGAIWTWIFGKSYLVLRISTLVLWMASIFVLDAWLRRLDVTAGLRWIAVLALAFHPIVLWSAFTFMTQVPFLFCSIMALAAFHKGLANGQERPLLIGAVFTVAAFMIRQTGVVLAVAAVVVIVRHWGSWGGKRTRMLLTAASPMLVFVFLLLFTNVMEGYPGQIREHFVVWRVGVAELPAQVASVVGHYVFFNLQNAGLFLAALVVAAIVSGAFVRTRGSFRVWVAATAFCVAGGAFMILKGFPMPYWSSLPRLDIHPGNIFVNLGLGPLTLRDTWTLGMPGPFSVSLEWRYLITYVAAVLGGGVLAVLMLSWRTEDRSTGRLAVELAVVHCIAATCALLPSGIYFDRYCVDSLWSLVVLIPVIVVRLSGWRMIAAASVCSATMLFGVFSTAEYLEWNRARWKAFHDLRESGVSLERMDGGYEINQYLIGGFDGPILLRKSGFSVIDNEYVIAFNRIPGYSLMRSYEFRSFLGSRRGEILVLRRVGPPGNQAPLHLDDSRPE